MKIGITCYPTYGGSGVVATELGLKLAARQHEVHFISYAVPMRLDIFHPNVFFHAVEVPSYPLFEYPPYSLALASKMVDVATHSKLDLIHAHYALPHATSAFLAREMVPEQRLRVVTTLHGTDITLVGNDHSFLPITRFSIERSDAVTAVSHWLVSRTEAEFGVRKPIEVIPNFIDLERFRRLDAADLRAKLAPKAEQLVMHVSNFRPVKRIADVISIFARLYAEQKVRLVLVGDGPDISAAEQMCERLGICQAVLFLGMQADLPRLFSAADLFLLPSEHESFGLAALEAMACEVPVVVSRAGGLPEVVEDGVTGRLAPVGDIEAFAQASLELLQAPERAREMGRTARRKVEERFAPDLIVDRYEALYDSVLAR